MNYDLLKIFLHLARTLHFGKTSQECYLSPSTLSRMIQRLEEEVGHPLFLRNNREVSLTSKGIQFRKYAMDALAEWERLKAQLNDDAGILKGEITVYCSVTACYSIVPYVLNQFRNLHPAVSLKLEVGNSINALKKVKQGAIDVSISTLPDSVPEDLEFRNIISNPLVLVAPVAPGPINEKLETSPIEWSDIPMIFPLTGMTRQYVNQWCQEKTFTPQVYSEVVGNEAILALVSMGCGVGVVPRLVIEKSPLQSDLRILTVSPSLPLLHVGIYLQKKKLHSPLIKALWDSIEELPQTT